MLTPCCEVSTNTPQFAKNPGTGERRGDSQAFRRLQEVQGSRSFRQFHLWKSLTPREPWLTVHRGPEVEDLSWKNQFVFARSIFPPATEVITLRMQNLSSIHRIQKKFEPSQAFALHLWQVSGAEIS